MVRVLGEQPGLFDASRLIERRLASGVTVRVRLEPLPHGHVRVLEYHRRGHDETRWHRRPDEEGRTYSYNALGLGLSFDEVFA